MLLPRLQHHVVVAALVAALPAAALSQTLHADLVCSDYMGDAGILVGALQPARSVVGLGDFTYLFASEDDTNAFMVDVNAGYPVFSAPAGPAVSVIGGLNVFRWSYSFEGFRASGTDVSPAAGARLGHSFGPSDVFGQGQYVIAGDFDGITFGGGVSFMP